MKTPSRFRTLVGFSEIINSPSICQSNNTSTLID
jgi:hypothetical protein